MTKRAVLFGDNYPGTSAALSGCVNDVDDIEALLLANGWDRANVAVYRDTECTRAAMMEAVTEAAKATGPVDLLWVYRSGHGSYKRVSGDPTEPDNRMELHVPSDYGSAGMIPDDEFALAFRWAHPWGRIVFGVDTCHAGTPHRFAPALMDPDLWGMRPKPRLLPPQEWLDDDETLELAARVSRAPSPRRTTGTAELMGACQDFQLAADAWFRDAAGHERANGAFTYALREAIRRLQGVGREFSHRELMATVRTMLPSQDFPDQEPRRDGPGARWLVFSEEGRR